MPSLEQRDCVGGLESWGRLSKVVKATAGLLRALQRWPRGARTLANSVVSLSISPCLLLTLSLLLRVSISVAIYFTQCLYFSLSLSLVLHTFHDTASSLLLARSLSLRLSLFLSLSPSFSLCHSFSLSLCERLL